MRDPFALEVSRRQVLGAGAFIGGGALLLSACGGSSGSNGPDTGTAGAGVSRDGGPGDKPPAGVKLAKNQTATFALSNLPSSIDPMLIVGGGPRRFDIYEALIDVNPVTGAPRPFLATSWKAVDPSNTQLTLRSGVKFHNGDPLTAEDVVFSMQRALVKDYAISKQFINIAEITAVDDATVQVTTSTPDVLILKKIAQVPILPKKYYMSLGSSMKERDNAFAKAPVGSGPYKFVSYTPQKAVVAKASTTWRSPTLEQVTLLQIADTGTQLNSFLAGGAQYVNLMPLTSLPSLKSAGATLIPITTGNDLGAFIDTVDMNGQPKTGPTGNQQVRQALQYALNKKELVEQVLKGKTNDDEGQLIGRGLPGYNSAVKAYDFDLRKAGQILDGAGYKVGSNGKRFSMTMASAFAGPGSVRVLIGEYMQNSLAKLDIDVKYTAITDTTLALQYFYDTKQRPDIYHFGLFTRPYMDAAKAYSYFTSSSHAYHMNDPQFDTLYGQQQAELDPAKRQNLLAQMTQIMHDQAPYLFACGDVWVDAAAKKLQGVVQCDVQTEQYLDRMYLVA